MRIIVCLDKRHLWDEQNTTEATKHLKLPLYGRGGMSRLQQNPQSIWSYHCFWKEISSPLKKRSGYTFSSISWISPAEHMSSYTINCPIALTVANSILSWTLWWLHFMSSMAGVCMVLMSCIVLSDWLRVNSIIEPFRFSKLAWKDALKIQHPLCLILISYNR